MSVEEAFLESQPQAFDPTVVEHGKASKRAWSRIRRFSLSLHSVPVLGVLEKGGACGV